MEHFADNEHGHVISLFAILHFSHNRMGAVIQIKGSLSHSRMLHQSGLTFEDSIIHYLTINALVHSDA